jgi:betaine-aldehyde dehydrogenase
LAGAVGRPTRAVLCRADQLRHGTVWINDYNTYLPPAEWGGFKAAGHRRELAPSGLDGSARRSTLAEHRTWAAGWFGG